MKALGQVFSVIYALFIIIGFGFISFLIYLKVDTPLNYIISGSIVILSFFVAKFVYTVTMKRGAISMLAGNYSSYDMDDLKPSSGHGVKQIHPDDLDKLISTDGINLNKCSVTIWGDGNGRKLQDKHEIETTTYKSGKRILTLRFKNNCILKIRNPTVIHVSNSYLKVFNAKEVLWQIEEGDVIKKYSYLNTGDDIRTQSNDSWLPHSEDLGVGMHAVYLQC